MGKPYIFAATGPNSFDCSGFTQFCFKQVGVTLPRTAYLQGYQNLTRISKKDLQRGDLIAFNTQRDSTLSNHVGIYLGNDEFIHCSSTYNGVIITNLTKYGCFSWGLRMF